MDWHWWWVAAAVMTWAILTAALASAAAQLFVGGRRVMGLLLGVAMIAVFASGLGVTLGNLDG